MKGTRTAEEYIKKHDHWKKELAALRKITLSTPLQETIKWGAPIYTLSGKNVVGMAAFKSHVALWFFQGALLKDSRNKLINAQANKTKALRQWRFSSHEEIVTETNTIRKYIEEAMSNQKEGKAIKPDRDRPLIIPPELKSLLSGKKGLKAKFDGLSKSKRREFAEYIAGAKREETKQKRLCKIEPMIMKGIGLNDRYRK